MRAVLRQTQDMSERFAVRAGDGGYAVIDRWTGEIAQIAAIPQSQLSEQDADHTAKLLNLKAAEAAGADSLKLRLRGG